MPASSGTAVVAPGRTPFVLRGRFMAYHRLFCFVASTLLNEPSPGLLWPSFKDLPRVWLSRAV